jgi:hypothetical protein
MSFFRYIGGDTPGYTPPRRVYAWVDAPSAGGGESTRLDCVNADWADEIGGEFSLSVPDRSGEAERQVSMMLWREPTGLGQEGQVLEMRLRDAEPNEDATVLHYLNLWGPPIPRVAEAVDWPGPHSERAEQIRELTLIEAEDSSDEEVHQVLAPAAEHVDAVAVYDVGQGSCSALIARDHPQLYFDIGGGAIADARTFPTNLTGLCTTANPPIVLSHWHFDHWALAKRFAEQGSARDLLESTWIVPRQKALRPTAATLLGLIRLHGRALIRGAGAPTLRAGAISLHSCVGASLNDSGMAMVVHGSDQAAILLPGDARYRYIVDCPEQVTSLVVAHHGGHTGATVAEFPRPDQTPAGRLVYSSGFKNSYRHPLKATVLDYTSVWPAQNQMLTAERGESPDPRHIHLYWDESDPPVQLGCRGHQCSLLPDRR